MSRSGPRSTSITSVIRPGPRRHHDHARREVHGLGDRVGDEHHGRRGLPADARAAPTCMCSRVISSSAPNGSSISRSAGWAASARAIATRCCIPPESCHGMWSANSRQLHQVEHLERALATLGLAPVLQLQRELDVLRHGPPVEQPGLLERHPVVLIEPRLAGRLAVHHDLAGGRLGQVRDQAELGRLAASRGTDQRDELAGLDREVDVHQRVDGVRPAGVEDLREVADLDARSLGQSPSDGCASRRRRRA